MKPRTLMGIWLDSSKAVVVTIEGQKTDVKTMGSGVETQERIEGEGNQASRFGNQFVEDERAKEKRIEEAEARFLEKLLKVAASADQLLVFGPAHMKVRFEKMFNDLTGRKPNLRAVEAADSMSDNQIAARVREFYGKAPAAVA